jgi:hypothetical protein
MKPTLIISELIKEAGRFIDVFTTETVKGGYKAQTPPLLSTKGIALPVLAYGKVYIYT